MGHAGAGAGAATPHEAMVEMLGSSLEPAMRSSLAPVVSVLEGIRRQGEDDKNTAEGTLGYLRGHCRWYVYLARG